MTQLGDMPRGRDTVARWCNLAERRLEHLTELFDTGRWRLYHTERAFLENIQEAKTAVETWRDLMARDAAPDHLRIDLTGKRPAVPAYTVIVEAVASPAPEPAPIAVEPSREIPLDVLTALEIQLLDADATSPDEADLDDMQLPPLDLDSIPRRYPLLFNAL
jgi:uncharacterized repeat protein (TIGR03809 family)